MDEPAVVTVLECFEDRDLINHGPNPVMSSLDPRNFNDSERDFLTDVVEISEDAENISDRVPVLSTTSTDKGQGSDLLQLNGCRCNSVAAEGDVVSPFLAGDNDYHEGVSIEIEEGDSVFNSDEECSSLSVSGEENELDSKENMRPGCFPATGHSIVDYFNSDTTAESLAQTVPFSSDEGSDDNLTTADRNTLKLSHTEESPEGLPGKDTFEHCTHEDLAICTYVNSESISTVLVNLSDTFTGYSDSVQIIEDTTPTESIQSAADIIYSVDTAQNFEGIKSKDCVENFENTTENKCEKVHSTSNINPSHSPHVVTDFNPTENDEHIGDIKPKISVQSITSINPVDSVRCIEPIEKFHPSTGDSKPTQCVYDVQDINTEENVQFERDCNPDIGDQSITDLNSKESVQNIGSINLVQTPEVAADLCFSYADTSSSKPAKRLFLHIHPSSALSSERKRALVSIPGDMKSRLKIMISPDVVEGHTLNLGWVERVNRTIAANSTLFVSSSSDDLIRHAKDCRIMKRFSEKLAGNMPRSAERLKKKSPSDIRHDKQRSPDRNCQWHVLSDSKLVSITQTKTSNHLTGFSHEISNIDEISEHENASNNTAVSADCFVEGTTSNIQKTCLEDSDQASLVNQHSAHLCENLAYADIFSSNDASTTNSTTPDKANEDGYVSKLFENNDESESVKTNLDNKGQQDSLVNRKPHDEAGLDNNQLSPTGLIRKPAVRRKGYAWVSKGARSNSTSDLYGRHNQGKADGLHISSARRPQTPQLFKGVLEHRPTGSSLDLVPSLLSLYDHRIASKKIDNDAEDHHPSTRTITKTQSLPARHDEDAVDGVQHRNGRLTSRDVPADRPVSVMDAEPIVSRVDSTLADNKKRPLSISSVSSTSQTSSPRLRKKRQSTVNDLDTVVWENSHRSECTLVPENESDSKASSASELRHSICSSFTEADKNGDRYPDNISITSSETGSFRDEADSSLKDVSITSSPLSDRLHGSHMAHLTRHSNFQPHSPELRTKSRRSRSVTHVDIIGPLSSTPNRQAIYGTSPRCKNESRLHFDPSAPDIRLYRIRFDTSSGSDSSRRSSSSSLRHEARRRFFSNYEEYMRQPILLESRTAENKHQDSPNLHSKSSTLLSATPAYPEISALHSPDASAPSVLSASPKTEHFADHSSQLSGKAPGRPDLRAPTSPKSGFPKGSKKRDPQISSDTGSRSSPVYVSYVSRVVSEIIESERTYITSLKDIIHGYLDPMKKLLDSQDTKKDIECLFSNITDIYKFGCIFLNDLETAGADPIHVAQCFVTHSKGFVIYTDYCTNYPRAVEVLTRFMQHPELSELCKERQLALGHGLPLGAYLLKPVQRILKYHLLLHNIVKNFEKEREGAVVLEQAFQHMTQMAHHINEMKRKHEHAVRIQEIQSQLEDYVGEDLTRLGELVLEGTFKVSGAKASRQVFLFERGLLISKMKEGGMLSCKTFIQCSNLMLVEVIPNEPLSFHIIPFDNPRAQDTLQARNMEQKRRWCHDIKQQILESFKGRIPDNAKNLIMQLGRDHDDDYVSKETLDSGRRNHTAPEYLEKRRFRRKSGSRLPDFNILKPQKTKRGGNKKNESKSGEKPSEGVPRRAASRSPEGRRRLFSRQTAKRSQSVSSPSISVFASPTDQTDADSKTVFKNRANSSVSSCTSPESPVYRNSAKKFTYSKSEEGRTPLLAAEADVIKRPASFLMARANPILSEDIGQLMAKLEGSRKLKTSLSLKEDQEKEDKLSLTDTPDRGGFSLGSRSSVEDYSDNEEYEQSSKGKSSRVNNSSKDSATHLVDEKCTSSSKPSQTITSSSKIGVSSQSSTLYQNVNESRSHSKTRSLDLSKSMENNESVSENKVEHIQDESLKGKKSSQTAEQVHKSEQTPKATSRMSRRDMYSSAQNVRKNGNITEISEQEKQQKEHKLEAPSTSCTKGCAENLVLKRKGLRLPNTSQHLSLDELEPGIYISDISFQLNKSLEKPIRNSSDLSLLDRDSSVTNSEVASSGSDMDAESLSISRSSLSVSSQPQGHSNTTDLMLGSNNNASADFLHIHRILTSSAERYSARRDNVENKDKFSSIISYINPSFDNMKKLSSRKNRDKRWFSSQEQNDRNSFSSSTSGSLNALGISPVTVTMAKPVSFSSSNLLRSNSTPIPNMRGGFDSKSASRSRPVSLDVDKLTDESNRLVAEMEEYINKYSECVVSTNRFPTSLSAITGDEEGGTSNRLSIVSSVSTSSYESHSSSSSDGLVCTHKSKSHVWGRSRNDSEYSCVSTLPSENDDREEFADSFDTKELQMNNRSWQEEEALEIFEDEKTFRTSPTGYHMECSQVLSPEQVEGSINCHVYFTTSESHSQENSDFTYVETGSEKPSHENEKPSELVQFSLPASDKEVTEVVPVLNNAETDQSNEDFTIQRNEIQNRDMSSPKNEVMSEIALDCLEESPEETVSNSRTVLNTTTSANTPSSHESDTCESLYSNTNCNEIKLSETSDSESLENRSENFNSIQQEDVEVPVPRKSIREYVQDFEEMHRSHSQKVHEVKRREPGVMIRQRLETLRESALSGRRSSSHSSSRPQSEERDLSCAKSPPPSCEGNRMAFSVYGQNEDQSGNDKDSIHMKLKGSIDNLSRSTENLSKSNENLYLSRSRESLNLISDIPGNRHSVPVFYTSKSNKPDHEYDGRRFHDNDSSHIISNQFIHRTHNNLEQSVEKPEIVATVAMEVSPPQSSQSASQVDETDSEYDVVVMKGWVRALISKFQDK